MLFNLNFTQVNEVEHIDEKAIELVSNCVSNFAQVNEVEHVGEKAIKL